MSIWYLGPYGDLRALDCPEVGISTPVTRYGGIHQGLSGARTVDVTGFKQSFQFEFEHLTSEQFAWMEALHLRYIPGPLFLLNPLKKNFVSREVCSLAVGSASVQGIGSDTGTLSYDTSFPTGVLGVQSLLNTGYVAGNVVRFGQARPMAVRPSETGTFSVYLRSDSNQDVTLVLDVFRADGTQTTSPSVVANMTSTWTRFSLTATSAADAAWVVPALVFNMGGTLPPFRIAAPQMERGSSATGWEMGGGSVRVLIDQLPTSSPLSPLTDATLTLLEA